MSQAQRNVGFTPFSRNDFYDKTYLQRLRNDVMRLDNANSIANSSSHHVPPAAASKYRVEQPLSPRPKGSCVRRQTIAKLEGNAGYNDGFLHPNRYSSRSKSPRSPSRSPSRRSNANRSVTPHKVLRSVTPRRNLMKSISRSRSRSPKIVSQTLGSNLVLLPSIDRSHSRVSVQRGKTMTREKSNLAQKAALEKRGSFPKIGMSELPSITITKKPVTPQNLRNNHVVDKSDADQHNSRMSRRDQHLSNQMRTPYHHSKSPRNGHRVVEVAVSPYPQSGYNRLVISPTNVSVYSNRSVPESLRLAADGLAALSVHGEKLTPQCSPRGSPSHSPRRYSHSPYMMATSHNDLPVQAHHYNTYRTSPNSRHHSVSPGQSPSRDVSPHLSPTNSVYNGSPSHSPARSFSRRNSDLSNYSGDDVSLHKYITQPIVHHSGVVYATQQSPYSDNDSYTPVSVAMHLRRRVSGSSKGSVSSRDTSPSEIVIYDTHHSPVNTGRQSSQVRDMGTQTFSNQETMSKPKPPDKHSKLKTSKKTYRNSKSLVQQNTQTSSHKDLSTVMHKDKTVDNATARRPEPPSNGKRKRKKAVLSMTTVTTVTPTSEPDSSQQDNSKEAVCYSRESTIHIDIDYDSNSTPADILKSAIIANPSNAHLTSIAIPQPIPDSISAPATPSHDRRSSVSGPIPEISLICATPDDLTPASPGIPMIDGEEEPSAVTPVS